MRRFASVLLIASAFALLPRANAAEASYGHDPEHGQFVSRLSVRIREIGCGDWLGRPK
jgi:hypothetical protein